MRLFLVDFENRKIDKSCADKIKCVSKSDSQLQLKIMCRCSQNANKGRGALMAQIKELRRDNDRAKDGRIITHAQPENP